MRHDWLRRGEGDGVLVVALGWACDGRVVEHLAPAGCDVLALHDYRTVDVLDASLLAPYRQRYLAAWSFGVWAAEQALREVPFDRAVALCGSPFPVDARYGIDPRRMAVTIRGLRRDGLEGFFRRSYGERYDALASALPPRPEAECLEELETLAALSVKPYTPSIAWDRAVIATRDTVFPPENLAAYWQERAVELPLPHYPFGEIDPVGL